MMAKIDPLFDEMIARGASDLHLGVGQPPLLRVQGELVPAREGVAASTNDEVESILFELVDEPQRAQLDDDLDLAFVHAYGDSARFRASYFFRANGVAAVFHRLEGKPVSLEELGVPEAAKRFLAHHAGLVVVAGASRSGTTSTLAAMVRAIGEARACHVLVVEEPSEITIASDTRAHVTRRQVGTHVPSLATALESAIRGDADVVVVPALSSLSSRDEVRHALHLAGAGVLVIVSVYATSAARALSGLTSGFGAEELPLVRSLVASALVGVLVQSRRASKDGGPQPTSFETLAVTSALRAQIRDGKVASSIAADEPDRGAIRASSDLA